MQRFCMNQGQVQHGNQEEVFFQLRRSLVYLILCRIAILKWRVYYEFIGTA